MKPVKIRFEKGSYFVVIPSDVLKLSKLKRGDYVIPVPLSDGIFLKPLREVNYGEDRKNSN